uniref:Secreted protein n=1 Tax=Panagrellus redivivus TaxID=6233 RepID=A0A7E4VIF0_PANRE
MSHVSENSWSDVVAVAWIISRSTSMLQRFSSPTYVPLTPICGIPGIRINVHAPTLNLLLAEVHQSEHHQCSRWLSLWLQRIVSVVDRIDSPSYDRPTHRLQQAR